MLSACYIAHILWLIYVCTAFLTRLDDNIFDSLYNSLQLFECLFPIHPPALAKGLQSSSQPSHAFWQPKIGTVCLPENLSGAQSVPVPAHLASSEETPRIQVGEDIEQQTVTEHINSTRFFQSNHIKIKTIHVVVLYCTIMLGYVYVCRCTIRTSVECTVQGSQADPHCTVW